MGSQSHIVSIVLTGGPGGGKTTSLQPLKRQLEQRGYKVASLQESSSALITGGFSRHTIGDKEYQVMQMRMQLGLEDLYINSVQQYMMKNNQPSIFDKISKKDDFVIVFFDRGALDGKAFSQPENWQSMLDDLKLTENMLLNRYDGVIHMVTAAKGAEQYYTLNNNIARTESIEEAIIADDRCLDAWKDHPNVHVIDNSTGIDDKVNRALIAVEDIVSKTRGIDIDRKNSLDDSQLMAYITSQKNPSVRRVLETAREQNLGEEFWSGLMKNMDKNRQSSHSVSDGSFRVTQKTKPTKSGDDLNL